MYNITMQSYMYVVTVLLCISAILIQAVLGDNTKCFKDESVGDREGNVYYCNDASLPRCCVENGANACCIALSDKNLTEQLQLWGVVAGLIALIAIIFVCCKNDISFCNSDMSCKERCYSCRERGKNKEAHIVEKESETKNQYYDNPIGEFSTPSSSFYTPREPYKFPPLPPVQQVATRYDSSYA
ncbi:uncharacterized protein LOC131940763 [Physella acuta]|uniref:uncharacterized protein LOC131940763 n=1 Tax=Physella acuta TaxID=109671 RepID=UPI0027DE4E6E|nr:uncharacterized protein LOC131940763 [Physella acuta]